MGSPEQSCGAAPPDPVDTTSQWHRMMPRGSGDTAPCAGGLRCRAVLLLALCLSAAALPHILGSLVALSPGPSSQRASGSSLVAVHGDLLSHPRRAQMGAEGTSGCFHRGEDLYHGTDAEDLGMTTGAVTPELAASSVPTPDLPTASSFSHTQDGALGTAAPASSRDGQEQALQLETLPGLFPALPSEGTSSWAVWSPAAVTPGGLDAGGEAAPLVGTSGAEPMGNGSGLMATNSSLPPSVTSHGVSHPHVLAPFLPTEGSWGHPATTEEPRDLSPAHRALLPPTPVPTWTWVPSSTGPTEAGETSATPGATLEPGASEALCQDGAAAAASFCPQAVDVTQGFLLRLHTQMSSLAGPLEPTLGSVPPPSSPSPSYPPASVTTTHAPSSQTPAAPTLLTSAHPTASPLFVTSQRPSAASWVAAGETFAAGRPVTMGDAGSLGRKPPVHTLPLSFKLLGIAYTEALSQKSSGNYRQLEEQVRMMLHQVLSAYETFLQANILEFTKGSVLVWAEAAFQGDAPSGSHLVRTLVAGLSRGHDSFGWWVEPRSVSSSGFTVGNLDPEKLSVSFTVLGGTEPVERLVGEVTRSLSALYPVRNFTVGQLRNDKGDLEITGDLYLDTITHANVTAVLQALRALANSSVDLSSLSVQGARLRLQVYPFSFLVTNRHFREDLLDPLDPEHRGLSRALGDVVTKALRNHRSFLQAVIRGFLPGSLLCHGDVVFQPPAPSSLEVLEALVLAVGPDEALAGSDFQVDPYSFAVGEDTLEPPPAPGFPEYGVAIVVACGLIIVTIPVILLVCLRTKRLGWSEVAILGDRRDPEVGTQTLEMENQGFWAASEQAPTEEAPACCQRESSAC